MVTLAAVGLLIAAVITFLILEHSDELRAVFSFSKKTILPPLNFSQWTVAALVIAIGVALVVTFSLGVVNAMHRLTRNARDVFDWFRG